MILAFPIYFPNAEIVLLDNLVTQRFTSLFNLPAIGRYRFHEADVREPIAPFVRGCPRRCSISSTNTDAAETAIQPKQLFRRTTITQQKRSRRRARESGSRLVHLSSTSVYGTQEATVSEDCAPEDLKL